MKAKRPEVYGDKLRADQIEQIRLDARHEVIAEMRSEIKQLAPQARKLLLNAIPTA